MTHERAQALDDVEAKYQLANAAATSGAEEGLSQLSMEDRLSQGAGAGGRRRPQKASAYALCRKGGLGAALRGMGLTAEQFADNVDATYKRHEPQDPPVSHVVALVDVEVGAMQMGMGGLPRKEPCTSQMPGLQFPMEIALHCKCLHMSLLGLNDVPGD